MALKARPITACKHTDRKHYARGLCRPCYVAMWMTGFPDRLIAKPTGITRHPLYQVWSLTKRRAAEEGVPLYPEWEKSFANFLDYTGERPFKGAILYRIDEAEGFVPFNLVWGTQTEVNNRWIKAKREQESPGYGGTD